jgi:hypothetical protein
MRSLMARVGNKYGAYDRFQLMRTCISTYDM